MEMEYQYFRNDLVKKLSQLKGNPTGPEDYKLSISTTFTHPDKSRNLSGCLSPRFRCYLMSPERILTAEDLDKVKSHIGNGSMSSTEII